MLNPPMNPNDERTLRFQIRLVFSWYRIIDMDVIK